MNTVEKNDMFDITYASAENARPSDRIAAVDNAAWRYIADYMAGHSHPKYQKLSDALVQLQGRQYAGDPVQALGFPPAGMPLKAHYLVTHLNETHTMIEDMRSGANHLPADTPGDDVYWKELKVYIELKMLLENDFKLIETGQSIATAVKFALIENEK